MRSMSSLWLCVAVLIVGQSMLCMAGTDKKAHKKEAKAEKKAEIKADKQEKLTEKAESREKKAEAKADKKAEAKAGKEEERTEKAETAIEKRQDRQERRIQHGIKKGYLTQDEVAKLQAQQTSIENLETSALADGKITGEERKDIRTELNEASRCIWAEKHDTEGGQMATYRLGKNVFAKDDFTGKLENESLSPGEGKALMKDFRRVTELKRKLSTDDMSAADREVLQAKYDELLNKYFELRE